MFSLRACRAGCLLLIFAAHAGSASPQHHSGKSADVTVVFDATDRTYNNPPKTVQSGKAIVLRIRHVNTFRMAYSGKLQSTDFHVIPGTLPTSLQPLFPFPLTAAPAPSPPSVPIASPDPEVNAAYAEFLTKFKALLALYKTAPAIADPSRANLDQQIMDAIVTGSTNVTIRWSAAAKLRDYFKDLLPTMIDTAMGARIDSRKRDPDCEDSMSLANADFATIQDAGSHILDPLDATVKKYSDAQADLDRAQTNWQTAYAKYTSSLGASDTERMVVTSAQARMTRLKSDADDTQSQIDNVQKYVDQKQLDVDVAQGTADALQRSIDSLTSDIKAETDQSRIGRLKTALLNANAANSRAKDDLRAKTTILDDAKVKMDARQKALTAKVARVDAASKDLDVAKKSLTDDTTSRKTAVDQLNTSVTTLTTLAADVVKKGQDSLASVRAKLTTAQTLFAVCADNQKSSPMMTEIRSSAAAGDMVTASVQMAPLGIPTSSGVTAPPAVAASGPFYAQNVTVIHRTVLDVSSGLIATNLTNPNYIVRQEMNGGVTQAIVHPGVSDKVDLNISALGTFYSTHMVDTALGPLSFGPTIGVAGNTDSARYLGGLSLVLGDRNRLILSWGAAFGKVSRLNGDTVGQPANGSAPSIQSVFRAGQFLGVTYRLNF